MTAGQLLGVGLVLVFWWHLCARVMQVLFFAMIAKGVAGIVGRKQA